MANYDIAIIGAGPGGYVAAIRAARLGAKVALVEKDEVGGVCLNKGCIPTKALIASAHAFENVRRAAEFGIDVPCKASINIEKIMTRKNSVVETLRDGIKKLISSNGIDLINGSAAFTGRGKISVGEKNLDTKNILIATGSSWIELPNLKVDGKTIVTSDHVLNLQKIPESIAIIGGGVIGCEFACMLSAFGAKVAIIEATSSILPPVEKAVSRLLARSMKERGIEIFTDVTATGAQLKSGNVLISISSGKEISAGMAMVAVGRRPANRGLKLELAGVEINERGFITVDKNFKTTADCVYAIGDAIGNPMLAHAASAEGIAAVEGIFGKGEKLDLKNCPSPIFTIPEIASLGCTSEELKQAGTEFKTGRFPYAANGKALCDNETDGLSIVHADTNGKILGVHIFGKDATILIAEAALAVSKNLTVKEFAHTIHSHPTLSEAVAEAMEDVDAKATHKVYKGAKNQ